MWNTFLFLILLSLLLGAAFGPWAVFLDTPPIIAGHISEGYLREKFGRVASWVYVVALFLALVWSTTRLC